MLGLLPKVLVFDQVRYRRAYGFPERIGCPAFIGKAHIKIEILPTSDLRTSSETIILFASHHSVIKVSASGMRLMRTVGSRVAAAAMPPRMTVVAARSERVVRLNAK